MHLIYGWPFKRPLGTDSSFLAPALSLDSAFMRRTDPPLSLSDATWGRGQGEDAGCLIAILKISGCRILPRDSTLPATDCQMTCILRMCSLPTAFLPGNQQPGWDEVGTLPPSQTRDMRYERLLLTVRVWLVCLFA